LSGTLLALPLAATAQSRPVGPTSDVTPLVSPSSLRSPQTFSQNPTSPMPKLTTNQFQAVQRSLAARSGSMGLVRAYATSAPLKGASQASRAPMNSGAQCNVIGCIPYTTSRVANSTVNSTASTSLQPVGGMPYVATGRMWMATSVAGVYNSVCSASLIGKGLVVTAAHCIQQYGLGTPGTVKSARFIPGNNGNTLSSGPYGGWDVAFIVQPPSYKYGTDTCSTQGIVCNNDLAVLVLNKNGSGQYPYSSPQISYYGYGSNGYGFVTQAGTSGQGNGQITQLGYPCGLDNCQLMQRNDSNGLLTGSGSGSSPKQITIGSQMTGGSSGGPWIINFGTPSVLGNAASPGRAPLKNIVLATTSWGYINNQIQVQGASTFGQNSQYPSATSWTADGVDYGVGNIGALVFDACRTNGAVKGKTLGACW